MKKEEKSILIIAVILLILVIILTMVLLNKRKENNEESIKVVGEQEVIEGEKYTEKLEDGTKINTSTEFNSTKIYNDLEISNIQFTEKDGMSVLLADVKNTSNKKHEIEIVTITIIGENEEEISKIKPVIGEIEPGETIKLNASITADVTNAKDFRIENREEKLK